MAFSRRENTSAGAPDIQIVSNSVVDDEGRRAPRKTLFLSGIISVGDTMLPVRIRNLSANGAQLEGDTLPEVGTSVRIDRGKLRVRGTIVRRAKNGAGIRFDEPLVLDNWVQKLSARDQLIVDDQVEQIRSGMVKPTSSGAARKPRRLARDTLPTRLAEELDYVSRLIEQLGDVLAGDPLVVMRHPDALQNFDLSTQILRHVAALIVTEDPDQVIGAIGIESLRKRLLRKAL